MCKKHIPNMSLTEDERNSNTVFFFCCCFFYVVSLSVVLCKPTKALPALPQVLKRCVKRLCWEFPPSGSDPACSRGERVPSRLVSIQQRKSPPSQSAADVPSAAGHSTAASAAALSYFLRSQIYLVRIGPAYFDPGVRVTFMQSVAATPEPRNGLDWPSDRPRKQP